MDFIKRFETRKPEYPVKYREGIIDRFALVGGGDDELKNRTGKVFSNVYELYMYAAMLGLLRDYRLPVEGLETKGFIEINAWQPPELRQFILMSLLARDKGVDLNLLEDLEDSDAEKELTSLKRLLEEYAHGGFDIIDSKIRAEPMFFEGEFWVLELVGEQ